MPYGSFYLPGFFSKKKNLRPVNMASDDSLKQRRWCFTLQVCDYPDNPFIDDMMKDALDCFVLDHAHFKCGVCQFEIAPETRRVHLQGYIEFDAPVRLNHVKKFFGPKKPHLEVARGDWKQNLEYCTKPDTAYPDLQPLFIPTVEKWEECHQQQGKRNDLADAVETLRTKKRLRDVAESHPTTFVKYHKGFSVLLSHLFPPRDSAYKPRTVRYYWGPTNSGKTSEVYAEFDAAEIYVKECSHKWWDGYQGQVVVLFDDFDGVTFDSVKAIPIVELLRCLDRYPHQVETKGGMVPLSALTTTFIITSNHPFELCYPHASDGHRAALKRRITEFVEFPNAAARLRMLEYPNSDSE